MEKKEKKDQFVVAYIADYSEVNTVVSYSLFLSAMLRKGIILLRISDPYYTSETTAEAEVKLKAIMAGMPSGVAVTYCAISGNTREVVSLLPKALGAVVVVGAVKDTASPKSPLNRKRIFRDFSQSKVAFLMAQEPLSDSRKLQRVGFTFDFKKESKEKLVWSSYFARFFKSELFMLSYDYKDEFLRSKWLGNVKFADKLFDNLNVTYRKQSIGSRQKLFMDVLALDIATQMGIGLLVATTTNEKDAIEYFIGVQENRTAVNKYRIPILYINPRDDLYVLCD